MGAKQTLPILRADRFELGGRIEAFKRLIPSHHNRPPTEDDRDPRLWAVEGILAPERVNRVLLAVNIGAVEIPHPHPTKEDETLVISGEDIAAMLVSARMGRLSAEFPDIDMMDGNEARMLLPRAAVAPLYEEGMRVPAESVFPEPPAIAEPVGRVATGGNGGIMPVPAFNPA